jgi:hypothetical protein
MRFVLFAFLTFFVISGKAQTTSIKDIPLNGDTTISVSKGTDKSDEYRITEGGAEIASDPEVLDKDARKSWKKECDNWMAETKDLNRANKGTEIISMTCNAAICTKNDMAQTVCRSHAEYKIKTKIRATNP